MSLVGRIFIKNEGPVTQSPHTPEFKTHSNKRNKLVMLDVLYLNFNNLLLSNGYK